MTSERDDLLDLLHHHRDLFRFTVRGLSDEPRAPVRRSAS